MIGAELRNSAFYPEVPPISLELTSKCNLKCPYCTNSILTRQKKEPYIEWSLLEKLVDECADGQHNIAMLHGTGEPLMWNRLEEAVAFIKSRRAGDAVFATNGTLLTEDRIRRLLDAGMTSIRVSLDSLDENIYAATRGAKLSKTIANIQTLIRATPEDFSITIILMNHKDQEIRELDLVRFYQHFGVSPKVRMEVVENGLMVAATNDFRRFRLTVDQCWRATDWFTITHEGKVSICCSDQNAMHVLGDINDQTIEEIWFNAKNQAMFRNIAAGVGVCPKTCTQHCYLNAPDGTRTLDEAYSSPFGELLAKVESLLASGEFEAALKIASVLILRAPHDRRTKRLNEILSEVGARKQEGVFQKAAEERLLLIQELSKRCEDFTRQLREKKDAAASKDKEIKEAKNMIGKLQRDLAARPAKRSWAFWKARGSA